MARDYRFSNSIHCEEDDAYSYMAVTVHYIDAEWRLQSHCLQTVFDLKDHTAENLAAVLRNFGILDFAWKSLSLCDYRQCMY